MENTNIQMEFEVFHRVGLKHRETNAFYRIHTTNMESTEIDDEINNF